MITKIHIVDCDGLNRIVDDKEIKDGKIKIRHYDEWDDYYIESHPVAIKKTFLVFTNAKFIRNDKKDVELNAYYMWGGFGQVNKLAYCYSVHVIDISNSSYQLYESNCFWSDSGIASTNFNMYSYHDNEPKQEYQEWRLDYEVFDRLDFNKIFSPYLTTSDIRDNKIDTLLD
jgi:hypothetical protein